MKDFVFANIKAKNLDDAWFKMLVELATNGRIYKVEEGSFKDDFRIELDYCSGIITEPLQYTEFGIKLPISPNVPVGCPIPTDEESIENYFINYIMDGNKEKNEDYRYSTFIVGGEYEIPSVGKTNVPDQLHWVINHYKTKGFFNNHGCIQIGYPESNLAYDIPYDKNKETTRKTSPCLRLIDTKIIKSNEKYYLNLYVYFRSQDAYSGFPENYGGIIYLLEYMSHELGVSPGMIIFQSKGLHVYGHAIDALVKRTGIYEVYDRLEEYKKK